MVYVLSVNLKDNKKINKEICNLYGIGNYQASYLCNSLNFGLDCRVSDLTQAQVYKLLKEIQVKNLMVENELQHQERDFISELIQVKSYRGVRHIFKLPVRGQRTRTNARSRKKIKRSNKN